MTNKLTIEKNIPVPGINRRSNKRKRSVWWYMEVGDSVFIPNRSSSGFKGAYARVEEANGWKFTMRSVDGGLRVWRVQ